MKQFNDRIYRTVMDKGKMSNMKNEEFTFKRIGAYILGIFLVSLGIVLCKKCGMGISPISSIPFVLVYITPLTFGNLTTLFHFTNTIIQMILTKKILNPKLWLQVPLAFVFGWIIDLLNSCIKFDEHNIVFQILSLIFSVLFTALGMVFMLNANLIQNPPDGTVKQVSTMLKKELGVVKMSYDIFCVVISILISAVFLHRIEGFGIATIVSAIFVGRTIGWIKIVQDKLRK